MARERTGGSNLENLREWYVPDIDDNRDDPDPFMVEIEPMTAGEHQRMTQASLSKATRKNKKGFDAAVLSAAHKTSEDLFTRKVCGVKGYGWTNNGDKPVAIGGRTVLAGERIVPGDGAELLDCIKRCPDPSELEIVEDILEAIRNRSHLDQGLLKNLRSPSKRSSATAIIKTTDVPDVGAPNGSNRKPPSGSGDENETATASVATLSPAS